MIYKLFGVANLASDGMASLDIQNDGFIIGVGFILCPSGMDANGDFVKAEVSFMSTNTFSTNDTRGSIFQHCITQNFLTTGGGGGGNSSNISGLEIEVSAGERIFCHGLTSASVSADVSAYLFIVDAGKPKSLRPPPRRR